MPQTRFFECDNKQKDASENIRFFFEKILLNFIHTSFPKEASKQKHLTYSIFFIRLWDDKNDLNS